jgi:hypothetical protein
MNQSGRPLIGSPAIFKPLPERIGNTFQAGPLRISNRSSLRMSETTMSSSCVSYKFLLVINFSETNVAVINRDCRISLMVVFDKKRLSAT